MGLSNAHSQKEEGILGIHVSGRPCINTTYDGDEITVRIILLKKVAEAFDNLDVGAAALDLTKEGKFSGIVSPPQPTIMTWANYLMMVDKQ